jgi:hypothetical protein
MSTTIGRLNEKMIGILRRESGNHTFVILIFDGAGGAPGRHVLNAAASLHGPRPHELTAAIRIL